MKYSNFGLAWILSRIKFWFGTLAFFSNRIFLNVEDSKKCLNFIQKNSLWVNFHDNYKFFSLIFNIDFASIKTDVNKIKNNSKKFKYCKIKNKKFFMPHLSLFRCFYRKKKIRFSEYFWFCKNRFFLYCRFRTPINPNIFRKWLNLYKKPTFLNTRTLNPNLNQTAKILKEYFPKSRIDFRGIDTFSIDPFGSIEIDDVVHYRFLKFEIIHEIGIHIPDIFPVINVSNEIFTLLKERHKSGFFLKKKSNLFPKIFSINFFSLYQFMDRLSFSTIFLFDSYSKIKKIKFCRSIIKNKRCFSETKITKNVKEFKNFYMNKTRKCFFTRKIIIIKNICIKLRSNRIKLRGNTKIIFNFNAFKQSNKIKLWGNLLEELVILASVSMAENILHLFPNCTELRRLNSLKINDFSQLFKLSILMSSKIDLSILKKFFRKLLLVNKRENNKNWENQFTFLEYFIKNDIFFFDKTHSKKSKLKKINWGPLFFQFTAPIRRFLDIYAQQIFSYFE